MVLDVHSYDAISRGISQVRTNDGGSKFESAKKHKLGKKTITSVFTSN